MNVSCEVIFIGRRLTKDDDKIIYDLYVNNKMSSTQISKILKTSHRSVLNHLEQMQVKRRNLSEAQFVYNGKEMPNEFNSYDEMYKLYIDEHMTKEQIGKLFNCAPHVIDRVLKELHIPIRDASKSKIGVQHGEMHHNWKGGISSLYSRCREYFQTNISPIIRERDKYTCQLCGCHSNLHVHHIKYFSVILNEILNENQNLDINNNKEELYEIIINDSRFLDMDNLITYCKKCHLFKIHGYNKTIRSEAS